MFKLARKVLSLPETIKQNSRESPSHYLLSDEGLSFEKSNSVFIVSGSKRTCQAIPTLATLV